MFYVCVLQLRTKRSYTRSPYSENGISSLTTVDFSWKITRYSQSSRRLCFFVVATWLGVLPDSGSKSTSVIVTSSDDLKLRWKSEFKIRQVSKGPVPLKSDTGLDLARSSGRDEGIRISKCEVQTYLSRCTATGVQGQSGANFGPVKVGDRAIRYKVPAFEG